MKKQLDLGGMRFGRLQAVSRAPRRGRYTEWVCKCECGDQVIVRTVHLRSGNTKSCGCIRRLPDAAMQKLYVQIRNLGAGASSIEDRFLSYVMPEPNSGCWLWVGRVRPDGYGQFYINSGDPCSLAHRAAWKIFRGEIAEAAFVCHRCDVTICVNPNHLFTGTQSDNIRDMLNKGRGGVQRLTPAAVREIRASAESVPVLARRYGVVDGAIHNIITRTSWKHVA